MEIGQLERQISKREKRLQELRSELSAVEAALIAAETSTEDRVVLLSQTKALAQEQGQLEAEVQDLNVEVALKTDQLSSLRNTLASAAY
jgi:predicted  nucleic acid-binding Zn-ribbon protein